MSSAGRALPSLKCLPVGIKDRTGRSIQMRAYEAPDFKALRKMYDEYDPKGLECGLPPLDDRVRLAWLNHLVSEFFNILATHKGQVIGHAALDLSDRCLCPEYLVFIQKGFRNVGIGTALSQTMRKVAEEWGCEKIVLTVRTANRRAIRVFEKMGFAFCNGIQPCRDMALEIRPVSPGPRKESRE